MSLNETVSKVESSQDFIVWKESNPKAYLTSAFSMFAEKQVGDWVISYFNSETQTLASFSESSSKAQEEAFKKEEIIPELKLAEVKIDEKQALASAMQTLQDNSTETVQKTILVLQKLKDELMWNITFITNGMKVFNVKLSAVTGQNISHNSSAISDFMQQ